MTDRDPRQNSPSLDSALASLGGSTDLPPMSDALRAELDGLEPTPTARPLRRFLIAGLVSAAWMGGLLALLGLRRDLEPLPKLWLVIYVSAWGLTFLALGYGSQVPRRGSIMPRSPLVGRLGLAAGLGFVGAGLIAARQVPGLSTAYEPTVGNIVGFGYYCIAIGALTASLPIAIGAITLRHVAPAGAGWLGMALGASGGALGGLLLHLHCPIAEGTHLGFIHGGVVLIAAAAGGLVMIRASAIRRV